MGRGGRGQGSCAQAPTGLEGGSQQGSPVRCTQRTATSGQRGLFYILAHSHTLPCPRWLPSCEGPAFMAGAAWGPSEFHSSCYMLNSPKMVPQNVEGAGGEAPGALPSPPGVRCIY